MQRLSTNGGLLVGISTNEKVGPVSKHTISYSSASADRWGPMFFRFALGAPNGLVPTSLSFLPNQMKAGSRNGIALQQSLALRFARAAIGREALGFWMPNVLSEYHLKRLWQYRQCWRTQRMCTSVMTGWNTHFPAHLGRRAFSCPYMSSQIPGEDLSISPFEDSTTTQ